MTDIPTIIHLLRHSDRPVSHAKLMDDAARALGKTSKALKWFLEEHEKASNDWYYSIDLRHFKEIAEEALK